MTTISRQLRTLKALSAAEAAKRTIKLSGLSPRAMSRWADRNIIGLLNGKQGMVRERVTWIVEACQRVIQLHESMKLTLAPHTPSLAPDKQELFAETMKILKELNARLHKYKCLPVVRYIALPNRCFDVQYLFVAANDGAVSECQAVSWLMDHIAAVHLIRRCRRQECSKWFFAVTDHQKYCGDTCRKREAQQGPDFKRKRAQYMRDTWRPRQKEFDAKAERLAKGKSK
jgi:hypothetical protein